MTKPNKDEIRRLHRYFAIECNNEFWSLSEGELTQEEKQTLLALAFSSLYHWSEVGADENVHLANLAVARAYCVCGSSLSLQYAERAFRYFDGQGADWIQAFTNAVFSHALHITGEKHRSIEFYEKALNFQMKLSDGDRRIFDLTFRMIPDP